jgi:hypothetical protein
MLPSNKSTAAIWTSAMQTSLEGVVRFRINRPVIFTEEVVKRMGK